MVRIEGVAAYLPYVSEGRLKGLEIDVEGLRRLTIIVGRNASGKTSLLEALGYTMAVTGHREVIASSLAMIRTMRPHASIPSLFVGMLRETRASGQAGLLVEATNPLLLDRMFTHVRRYRIGRVIRLGAYDAILHDATRAAMRLYRGFDERLRGAEEESLSRFPPLPLRLELDKLPRILRDILGHDYELSTFTPFGLRKDTLPYPWLYVERSYLAYIIQDGRALLRAIVFDAIKGLVVAVRRVSVRTIGGVLVFHPGFAYRPFMFESLYYDSVKQRGLPRERDAVRLLRAFIPWFSGFELIGRELHVRSTYGRRISVYRLSDGQRAAVLLGLLYAASPRGSLALVDTPEAFVHPDGLEAVAGLVVSMVAEGNQVLVATQSIEMLKALLHAAREAGVLGETVVKHLRLVRGRVTVKGSWEGEDALGMVEELALDLRRA